MKRQERWVDFHLHTTNSDGKCTLQEMMADAEKAGLSAIAITDHNCFTLENPFLHGDLEVIPGAEFSTSYYYGENKKVEAHVIGLFFQGVDPALNTIFESINKMPYVEALVKKMNDLGNYMTLEEVIARHDNSKKMGRHNVAEVLVAKGYAKDVTAAMDNWVGNRSPYYMNTLDYIHYVELGECVRQICDSKKHPGIPILAHPYYYNLDKKGIEKLVAYYRDITDKPLGMEVYYGRYSEAEIEYLEYLADKYNLLPSTGSDRHRPEQPLKKGDYELLVNMKKAMHILK